MAKDRRLKPASARYDVVGIATAGLAGLVVYAAYFPSDSVAVERGDALWFVAIAFIVAIVGCLGLPRPGAKDTEVDAVEPSKPSDARATLASRVADGAPLAIAVWMTVAAVATSPPGNLRNATNEAWVWWAWAVTFPVARRLLADPRRRGAMLVLVAAIAVGMAVHALHQEWVSLPESRAAFRENPERVLRMAGVNAEPGSAEWMTFENRLLDGGPTATFALANSLAAPLLVGLVIAVASGLFRWGRLSVPQRIGWTAAIVVIGTALVATRSRSGLIAAAFGVALVPLLRGRLPDARRARLGIIVAVAVTALGGVAITRWGDREWVEQAPTSLGYRFQYWKSTWELAADRPWFGAGPGNFQAIYERYREPSAHEQIADPHNFFVETLAAGGFVPVAMLVAWLVSIGILGWRRHASGEMPSSSGSGRLSESGEGTKGGRSDSSNATRATPPSPAWVFRGGLASLVAVWLFAAAVGQMPDWEAHLIAVPFAIVVAVLVRSVGEGSDGSFVAKPAGASVIGASVIGASGAGASGAGASGARVSGAGAVVTGAALIAVFLHLSVSGGWTVPGVAMTVWVLAAVVCGSPDRRFSASGTGRRGQRGIAIAAGTGLLLILVFGSIRPNQQRDLSMLRSEIAFESGRVAAARRHLREAVHADPWSADPTLWLADSFRWELAEGPDRPDVREAWESAITETLTRCGEDPTMYRLLGEQRIHVYQRHGRVSDLRAAHELFLTAAGWSPSHQWLAAQAAVTAGAIGNDGEADRLAERAQWLAGLGGNIARALERQLVSRAEPFGRRASGGPVKLPASELLADRLEEGGLEPDRPLPRNDPQ